MEPVVNGLEENYGERIEFRWLDANSDQGSAIFRYYQLLGHPSYVLLNPDGEVLWESLGEQPGEVIEQQFIIALRGT